MAAVLPLHSCSLPTTSLSTFFYSHFVLFSLLWLSPTSASRLLLLCIYSSLISDFFTLVQVATSRFLSFAFADSLLLSFSCNSGHVFWLDYCCIYFSFCLALPPSALIITNNFVSPPWGFALSWHSSYVPAWAFCPLPELFGSS